MKRIRCPGCGKTIEVASRLYGLPLRCAGCDARFTVPVPIPPPPPPRVHLAVDQTRPAVLSPVPAVCLPVLAQIVKEPESPPNRHIATSDFRIGGESLALSMTIAVTVGVILILCLSSAGVGLLLAVLIVIDSIHRENTATNSLTKITAENFPQIDRAARTAARRLSMHVPRLYYADNPTVNASAWGCFSDPFIVIHAGAVKHLSPECLLFIIGHEMAHVKCGHARWLTLANAGEQSTINAAVAFLFRLIFLNWSRLGEYTADRGGLLACRDPATATAALALLEEFSGGNVDQLRQKVASGAADGISDVMSTHPTNAKRILAVNRFFHSGECQALLRLAG